MGLLGLRKFRGLNLLSFNRIVLQRRALSALKDSNAGDPILPVVIVGAGPVGLILSYFLTKLGVECAVLEKSKFFSEHPQAHFINNRTMELFRKVDGLADDILTSQPPVDYWRKFIYCTSLNGPILGSVDHMRPEDFDRIVSPVSVAHFSQHKLTRLLLNKLEGIGFQIKHSEGNLISDDGLVKAKEILMGHECISVKATDHGVALTALCEKEGIPKVKNINCKFLIGTDGARSSIRKIMGINMKGERNLQELVSVHFLSHDLGQYLINGRPGMLFFIFNTEAIGVLVAHDLNQGEFVLQVPYYPPQQKLKDFTSEMCERLISKLVGRELADIHVMDVKPWVMHAEVAEDFSSCGNRVILAGDAAHRFPPAGGFGMNTGIQDAHNLAWKLASVIQGIAPVSLLSTYEMERKEIASFNTALSVQNFKAAMAVPAALGLDPSIANAVHRAIKDTLGPILPSGLQKTILDGIFSIGRAQVSDIVLNENNPLGSSRLAKLRQILEGGKSLQLQFPAEDIGFRYLEGALVSDGDSPFDSAKAPTGRRRDYVPSTEPGSRLPHMGVRLLSDLSNEVTISTLDLVSAEKVEFLLIIAPVMESYQLAQAAFKVAARMEVPLKVCVMWSENSTNPNGRSEGALHPWKNFVDVVEIRGPNTLMSWWDLCQMREAGAILVRPDEHIAWRSKFGNISEPELKFTNVFETILSLNPCCTK